MNWPGPITGGAEAVASSVSVQVSGVSCSRVVTRKSCGVIAPVCGSERTVAIDVEEPEPGVLEPLDDHAREAPHQLEAELGVALAGIADAGRIELRRGHVADRARVEVPAVGREEPRPAEDVAGAERLDREAAGAGQVGLERDA